MREALKRKERYAELPVRNQRFVSGVRLIGIPDNTPYWECSRRASIPRYPARRGRIRGSGYADKLRTTRTRPRAVDSDPVPSYRGDPRLWG